MVNIAQQFNNKISDLPNRQQSSILGKVKLRSHFDWSINLHIISLYIF